MWRWMGIEYERLVDLGAFDREPLELFGGQLIVAEPQSGYHVTAVGMLASRLGAALPAAGSSGSRPRWPSMRSPSRSPTSPWSAAHGPMTATRIGPRPR